MAKLSETPLCTIKPGVLGGDTMRCSPDHCRFAYVVQRGRSSYHFARGIEGLKYSVVVNDDVDDLAFDEISGASLRFSPDSKRLAYIAAHQGKGFVCVIDGRESIAYAAVGQDSPIFSPDSRRVAYAAALAEDLTFYVVDDEPGPEFMAAAGLVFSPDSTRTAYIGMERKDSARIVTDGVPSDPVEGIAIPGIVFSPDSRRVAFAAFRGAEYMVIVDGQAGPIFQKAWNVVFSPDSQHVAYTSQKGEGEFVCVDGKRSDSFRMVGSSGPVFRPDSGEVACAVLTSTSSRGEKWFVLVGSELVGNGCDGIGTGSPVFSPDSRHMAYAAQVGDQWRVVVDGVEGPLGDGVSEVLFSADSEHYLYRIDRGSRQTVIVDGKEVFSCGGLGGTSLLFSPDSKHVLFDVTRQGASYIVVDDEEFGPYEGLARTSAFAFEGKNVMRALAMKGYDVRKVEIDLDSARGTIATLGCAVDRGTEQADIQQRQLQKTESERNGGSGVEKTKCSECGTTILASTAQKTGGLCRPCSKGRPSSTKGEGDGCFIATAACGTASEPDVVRLRRFRDQVLQPRWLGRAFIRTYCVTSPPFARFIAARPGWRKVIRTLVVRPAARLATWTLRVPTPRGRHR